MPCRDYSDYSSAISSSAYEAMLKTKLDETTRLLCELCGTVEARCNNNGWFTKELKTWWNNHKKDDEQRKLKELQDLEQQEKNLEEQLKIVRAQKKAL